MEPILYLIWDLPATACLQAFYPVPKLGLGACLFILCLFRENSFCSALRNRISSVTDTATTILYNILYEGCYYYWKLIKALLILPQNRQNDLSICHIVIQSFRLSSSRNCGANLVKNIFIAYWNSSLVTKRCPHKMPLIFETYKNVCQSGIIRLMGENFTLELCEKIVTLA